MTVIDTERVAARIAEAAAVVPSERQLSWQGIEFYGFIHFGMNTMTDREWGDGTEDPLLFDPSDVDVDEWVRTFAASGMGALILTCKHHDGFALWPTALSAHSVASSPWRDGRGDLVAEVADACRRHGLRFGIYLSPWDRAEGSYGSGRAYDDFFVGQLTELLTAYGDIFCVWLDGANGEGPDGRVQLYDWDRYYAVVRELQPSAVISVCGPDVRWCGNEAGVTRADEWSVVPAPLREAEGTASRSQKVDDGRFSRLVASDESDLGSRAAILSSEDELVWYPAEVNTSIRPGWFHHAAEDDEVRSVDELFDIYTGSVGGNATFLLNVPPDRNGRLGRRDVEVLEGLGERLRAFVESDIAPDATLTLSGGTNGTAVSIDLRWSTVRRVSGVAIREDISAGQLLEAVHVVSISPSGQESTLASTSSVGYQRILRFDAVETDHLRVDAVEFRADPRISLVRVFEARS